jgi:TetR/AcrR family transcriptional regulator, transcriptional repressor for nem operon
MPRASKQQADANHQRVMEQSARLLRERGLRGPSVADLMNSAGLTHGGFYGHFDSKEQLVDQACAHAFAQSLARWKERIANAPGFSNGYSAIVEGFLSTRSRDNPGGACPTPALAADIAREPADAPVRATYSSGVEQLVNLLQSVQAATADSRQARRASISQFSMMVGAMALARAVKGNALSDEILSCARDALLDASTGLPSPDSHVEHG